MPKGNPAGYLPSVKKTHSLGGARPYKNRKLRKQARGLKQGKLPNSGGALAPSPIRSGPPNPGSMKAKPRPVQLPKGSRKIQTFPKPGQVTRADRNQANALHEAFKRLKKPRRR